MLPVYRCNVLQVCNFHEGFVKVVQLQDTGQQEEAWDHNTGEELGESERLQTNCCQPERGEHHYFTLNQLLCH